MKELEEFELLCYTEELAPKFNVDFWEENDICDFLNLTIEEFNYLIIRTGKKCLEYSWKTSFNMNVKKDENSYDLTALGIYFLVFFSSKLKKYKHFEKYVNYFLNEAKHDLIRYQGFNQVKKKKAKRENSNYDFEKKGEYAAKVIGNDLKVTNLDIDNKDHLFYDKKIFVDLSKFIQAKKI